MPSRRTVCRPSRRARRLSRGPRQGTGPPPACFCNALHRGSQAVAGVRLGDGSVIPADLVVTGVGITPNSDLAARAGLVVGNGITVDDHLRTSDPDIWAAGDDANAYHPLLTRHVRVEHWANAQRQGVAAARAMLGQDAAYDRLPYFFSDQYDLGMEFTGHLDQSGADHLVVRGDLIRREFVAFWLAHGRVLAGMNVNTWDVAGAIDDLVRSARAVDEDRLADPDVPLGQV